MQTPPPEVMPTERQIKAAEIVAEKLLSGIGTAANQEPTHYLDVVAVCAALVATCTIVVLFLRYLQRQDEKTDARESERQKHYEKIAENFAANSALSQRECHTHSLAMMAGRNEQTAAIKDIAVELAHACENVKQTGTTVGEIAKTAAKVVDHAMAKLDGKNMGS